MRILSVILLLFVFITIIPFVLAQQEGIQTKIRKNKSGEFWILDKGTNDGVMVGMKGLFWTKYKDGNKEYNVDIAKFSVEMVEEDWCSVRVEEIDAGYCNKYFQWATFIQKLIPPNTIIPSGKSIKWYMERGEEYYGARKYKLAEAYFFKVLEKDSEEPGALFWLRKTRERLLEIKKQRRDKYIEKGDKFFKEGKFDIAIAYFIKASQMFEENNIAPAEKMLKKIQMTKENFAGKRLKDITVLEDQLKEKLVKNIVSDGDRKFNEARYEEAAKLYSRAAEINPNNKYVRERIEQTHKLIPEVKLKEERKKNIEMKQSFPNRNIDIEAEIGRRLNNLAKKNISIKTKAKYNKEVLEMINAAGDIEALVGIFNQYNDQKTFLKSLKFNFFRRVVEKFKVSDHEKYLKYFKMYSKYGRVSLEEIKQYLKLKITNYKGILTFEDTRNYLEDKISRAYKNEKEIWEIELKNGIKFVFIPAGDYKLQERYSFVNSFLIGKYEITNKQYEKFCIQKGIKFRIKKKKYNHPVVKVSWNDSKKFCQWLSEQTKLYIDLPSEAQWERAALSGSGSIYYWGEKINGDYLWFWGNSKKKLHEVGTKKPNNWGIYDILGNAAEWAKDWFVPINRGVKFKFLENPIGPKKGTSKVIKGGGWYSSHKKVTIPTRISKKPKTKDKSIGFRVVINLEKLKSNN